MFFRKSPRALENKIMSSAGPIVVKDMGMLYGQVYFIKVSADAEDIAARPEYDSPAIIMPFDKAKEIMDLLDSEPDGRKTNNILNFLTSGNFLMARTDENAMHHYHLYARNLHRPVVYMKEILQEMNRYFSGTNTRNLIKTIRFMVRDAVAKGLFNLEVIPENLQMAFSNFDIFFDGTKEPLEKRVKNNLSAAFPLAAPFLYLSPFFMRLRMNYAAHSADFLHAQAPIILKELHDYAEGGVPHSIITLSVIELIKEEVDVYRTNIEALKTHLLTLSLESVFQYLKKPEIISLLATLGATENLTVIFESTLQALHSSPDLIEKLHAALKTLLGDLTFEVANLEQIKTLFDKDEAANGYLHRFYLESLRREDFKQSADTLRTGTMSLRYTNQNIKCGDYLIPKGSSIVFLPGVPRFDERLYPTPDTFDPDRYLLKMNQHLEKYPLTVFNEAKRRCPAAHVSSYITKMFISHLVLHYDFNLQKAKEADKWPTLLQVAEKQGKEVVQEAMNLQPFTISMSG